VRNGEEKSPTLVLRKIALLLTHAFPKLVVPVLDDDQLWRIGDVPRRRHDEKALAIRRDVKTKADERIS
jgi:hypothetical protein